MSFSLSLRSWDKTSRAIVEILNLDFIRIFTLNSNGHYYYQVAYSKDPLEVSSQAENPALLTAELIFKQIAISEPPLNPYFLGEAFSPEECLAIAGNVNAEIWLVPLSANSQKLGFLVLGKKDAPSAPPAKNNPPVTEPPRPPQDEF